ncbi:MAG: hypothetical protein Q9166_003961 [cf. Caloplaca sp. 2 TL-2023]
MANPVTPPNKYSLAGYMPSIPPRLSSRLTKSDQENLLRVQSSESDLKRKVSKISVGSTKSQEAEFLDLRAEQIENADAGLRDTLKALKSLDKAIHSDRVEDINAAIQDCLEKRARLTAEDLILRSRRARILEDMSNMSSTLGIKWSDAYSTLITQEFRGKVQATKSSRRDDKQQREWSDSLKDMYSSWEFPDRKGGVWCPVMKAYAPVRYRKAAHIVPWALGVDNITHIFGEDGYTVVTRYKNGLVLDKDVEKALDRGWIVIIPSSKKSQYDEFKTMLIDEDRRHLEIGKGPQTWGIKGWAEKEQQLVNGTIWATPDHHLQRSILAKLGESLGNITFSNPFLDQSSFSSGGTTEDDAKRVADEAMVNAAKPKLVQGDTTDEDVDMRDYSDWSGFDTESD